METEKQEYQPSEQRNAPAALADLPVTDEQAQQVAGGTEVIVASPGSNAHVKVFNGTTLARPRVDGLSPLSNHNETVAYDETDLDELEDLMLTAAQESDIKAGCPGCNWGPPLTNNHNETVAADEATEMLADLSVQDAEQVKGGLTSSSPSGTGKVISAVLLGKSN